jgi:Holliday junction resolvasome RuvABC endonuclease subunit
MRILALDLSLSATGFVCLAREPGPDALGPMTSTDAGGYGVIKTPARKQGESDWEWNRRRFDTFQLQVSQLVLTFKPDVLVVETSKKVFGNSNNDPRYSAGSQYRAGQGLGRAMGWLDATLTMYSTHGFTMVSSDVETAKRAITGKRTASKEAVKDFLERIYGWDLKTWDPNAVDALSLALAHLQITWQEQRDAQRRPLQDSSEASPILLEKYARSSTGTGSARSTRARRPS